MSGEDDHCAQAGAGAAPLDQVALAEVARMAEALVFASADPVPEKLLAERLPADLGFSGFRALLVVSS